MRLFPTVIGRSLLILLFLFFTFQLVSTPAPFIWLDAANLLFHEAGHMIFLPFGQFAHMIGGSLFQILFPCCFLGYFAIRKNLFACSVMLFWIADNVINVSVYMRDAVVMRLPLLVEGSIHDWNWIFSQTGLLSYSKLIGTTFFYLGTILIIFSFIGMIVSTLAKVSENP